MRQANPDDLDQLAKLIDGRGGIRDKMDEAFTRASSLGVRGKLGALNPLRAWANDTAPDLRKRATYARLEDGDPEAGLRWAGFSPEELKNYQGDGITPDVLLLANSVAASEDPKAYQFKREADESLYDWLERLTAHAINEIPGLPFHEKSIETLVGLFGDWHSLVLAAGVVTVSGTSLTRVLVGNTFQQGAAAAWKLRVGTMLQSSSVPGMRWSGSKIAGWAPKIRSLGAPGAWLPGQLGGMFSNSAGYQNASRVPFTTNLRGDVFGAAWDGFRSLPLIRSEGGQKAINFLVGSDKVAQQYGGLTHSGQPVARAGQANLRTVFKGAAAAAPEGTSSFRAGMGAATKTAGFFRGLGVVGGVASTGLSAANVASQGWPWDAFEKKGVGYIADIAEVGFNASLTAAMVAPTPFTVGAAVVTGVIYGGLKVAENWPAVKEGLGKAKDWTKDKAKSLAKKANPMNWF
ncbi:PE-PGRS family protein [Streptomyces sp. ISL-43]|uniref:PE-PGRS family protein n=1 Tax=Streptomyces sp. ISL-43 TaxID=2819183 RepID=UPI001BEA3456|nr:PE-PGRS family protein [Streptomyces sp. ISL-43]MBT2451346.1 PE-PGRS family protein [Streptomyces sp. ISL-43]